LLNSQFSSLRNSFFPDKEKTAGCHLSKGRSPSSAPSSFQRLRYDLHTKIDCGRLAPL